MWRMELATQLDDISDFAYFAPPTPHIGPELLKSDIKAPTELFEIGIVPGSLRHITRIYHL